MNLVEFDDAELLELMADREGDQESARMAFDAFYERHFAWFYWQCEKHKAVIPGRDFEGFALDIMLDIYESKAKTFQKTNFATEDDSRRAVRGWLCKIAQNRSIDRFNETKDIAELTNIDELYVTAGAEATAEGTVAANTQLSVNDEPRQYITRPEVLKAATMIGELGDRDRSIVMTYLHYWEPGKRIPNSVLKGLAEEHNLSREGVRKIFSRFRGKVKEAIQDLKSGGH